MNVALFLTRLPFRQSTRREDDRGAALILVLAFIVLISMLVIAVLMHSQGELRTSALASHSVQARLGADSVQRIVQGQILSATTAGIDADGRGTMSWASQPGAIRVFDDKGKESEIFKLYSSSSMIAKEATAIPADMPSDWASLKEQYVDLNEPVKRGADWIFPIVNPGAIGTVAGFASSIPAASSATEPNNQLVMPVRWLYVLEDGTITSDSSQGDPYLRVAFWTDDESSKINLNTASATDASSFWDIPRATYKDDSDLYATRQPVQNEFNRYSGHPASVNLKTVFPDRTIESLIQATPRYEWGGSENGSKAVTLSSALPNSKLDRLYATTDEFLYAPQRTGQLNLDASEVDARRFFLTTASRSSDLNLFGQPRVTIWPISGIDDDQHRTVYDRTIAFSSTLGDGQNAKSYYFLRSNPNSQTDDWTLYDRNQEVFSFLQGLTARAIPGFGGNFLTKYDYGGISGERDQILTEIFDYIRTVNLTETYKTRDANLNGTKFLSYTNDNVPGNATNLNLSAANGSGWVLPIKTPFGRGAGRVPVISEVGLWFIQMQDVAEGVNGGPPIYSDPDPPQIQPGLIIETFSPMQGVLLWVPRNFSYRVRNITAPQINGRNLISDGEYRSTWKSPGGEYSRSQSQGGTDGFAWLMSGGLSIAEVNHLGDVPFLTSKPNAIVLPEGAATFTISAGELEVDFMTSPSPNTRGQGTVFQTYRIKIPETTLPVPQPVQPALVETEALNSTYAVIRKNGWNQRKSGGTAAPAFLPQDVVRGLAIAHGDYRTEAYLEKVPASFFQNDLQLDYGFRTLKITAYRGSKSGSYLSGLAYPVLNNAGNHLNPRPKIPSSVSGLVESGWDADFDNGIAGLVDGPYLNKSDEGALPVGTNLPYFFERNTLGEGLFSPLRQVPSAVVFGSLPTGVKHTESGSPALWRTLAFSPNPLSGAAHLGLSDPPDHLLLDLFTMPVVEPYAISEPFSTAGRININHKLVPFSHITRTTALRAALSSQQVIAISDENVATYKTANFPDVKIRFPVDATETLKYFDTYLAAKNQNIFRSATEICGIYLVPEGETAASVSAWWSDRRLTGNNSRERPYATLYPLLTTKSNVFTTHMRVQAIKRKPSGGFNVRSEYRGSVVFERYLDPAAPDLLDGTIDSDAVSLEPWFQFRILNVKQFDP